MQLLPQWVAVQLRNGSNFKRHSTVLVNHARQAYANATHMVMAYEFIGYGFSQSARKIACSHHLGGAVTLELMYMTLPIYKAYFHMVATYVHTQYQVLIAFHLLRLIIGWRGSIP
jgi:hypothetical protein